MGTDDFDPCDEPHEGQTCPRCDGWREVNCHCGGDLCVCENYGDMDCPLCHGEGYVADDVFERYCQRQRQREIREAFQKASESTP